MVEFFSNFHFLRPWWLVILIPGGLLWWHFRRSGDPRLQYKGLIAPHLLKHLVIGKFNHGLLNPVNIFPLFWMLLALALAGPCWRMEPSPFAEQQAGLMVVLNSGSSMNARDLPPSRLERAKFKMRDLFVLRGQEPTGLIAYSGSAHLVMPLTTDTRIIEQMAGELDPTVMPVDGDRLDTALELARQQIERSGNAGSILVITSSIDEARIKQLEAYSQKEGPKVQVLAMAPEPQAARAAVTRGARALDARVHTVTVDDGDIRGIVSGARRMVNDIKASREEARKRDDGYLLVPAIVMLIALWARRGWSLQWQ